MSESEPVIPKIELPLEGAESAKSRALWESSLAQLKLLSNSLYEDYKAALESGIEPWQIHDGMGMMADRDDVHDAVCDLVHTSINNLMEEVI